MERTYRPLQRYFYPIMDLFCIFAESRGPDPHTNTRTYRLAVCPLSHKVYSPWSVRKDFNLQFSAPYAVCFLDVSSHRLTLSLTDVLYLYMILIKSFSFTQNFHIFLSIFSICYTSYITYLHHHLMDHLQLFDIQVLLQDNLILPFDNHIPYKH